MLQVWPQARSDDRGHVYVTWYDTRDGGGSLYVRVSDDFGRTWREEIRVKGPEGDVQGPMQFVATAPGQLYLAWADNRDGEYGIYLAASTDHDRTWAKEVRLDVGKAELARVSLPTLAADASGRVYVVWQDARHGGWDFYLNWSVDAGQTWQSEGVRLNTGAPGEAEARLPQLALDGQGTLAVAWQEDRGADQQEGIYLRWSTDFGGRRLFRRPGPRLGHPPHAGANALLRHFQADERPLQSGSGALEVDVSDRGRPLAQSLLGPAFGALGPLEVDLCGHLGGLGQYRYLIG
jgi:BNR repeat-like domain